MYRTLNWIEVIKSITQIHPKKNALDQILKLNPVKFNLKLNQINATDRSRSLVQIESPIGLQQKAHIINPFPSFLWTIRTRNFSQPQIRVSSFLYINGLPFSTFIGFFLPSCVLKFYLESLTQISLVWLMGFSYLFVKLAFEFVCH